MISRVLVWVVPATTVSVNLNIAAIATIVAALIAAYPSFRLLRANRAKAVAETGKMMDDRIYAYADRVESQNRVLRSDVDRLEGKLEAVQHRCDVLENLLMTHGIPVPHTP